MRGFVLSIFLFISCAAGAAVYTGNRTDLPALMRALVASRSVPIGNSSPRLNSAPPTGAAQAGMAEQAEAYEPANYTKQQYIAFLKTANIGGRGDCQDRYNKYNDFFRYDSSLGGQISPRDGGPSNGRLDNVCNFLGYSHWCFALGFAYAVRDLDDPIRAGIGNRCFTYQEFCSNVNKAADSSKIDEYLSRIIDEIMVYYSSIRNTTRNTVAITTETSKGGALVSSTSYRVYDTDTWVRERVSTAEMIKLLCR